MVKKKVVWGTGFIASRYVNHAGSGDIAFFIDSKDEKRGTLFFGKTIYHPSQIVNWDELFILVPANYYEEITALLRQKGLQEKRDFEKYYIPLMDGKEDIHSEKFVRFYQEIEKSAHKIKNKILIEGNFVSANTGGMCNFLNIWNEKINDEFVLFSETSWLSREEIASRINFPFFIMPQFFDSYSYEVSKENVINCEKEKKYIKSREDLYSLALSYRKQCVEMTKDYEYYYLYYLYQYSCRILEICSPKRMVLFGAGALTSIIFTIVCKEKDIPTGYIHAGLYPGTMHIDVWGEIGGTYPARVPRAFHKLQVNKGDLKHAEDTLDYLRRTGKNRKVQPHNNEINRIKQKIMKGRPIVFFAGQNDFESGLQQPKEIRIREHSPVFQSSYEAALYIAHICEKNGWNYIYKPHPMLDYYIQGNQPLPDNVIFVDKADVNQLIDLADVTVTILSTIAYNVLTRNKPMVMLGYTQLKGKQCTYEAFTENMIEPKLKEALENGFTERQRQEFVKHTAQCLKYYLFDDLQPKPFPFGRQLPVTWEEIEEFAEQLHVEEIRLSRMDKTGHI